MPTSQGWEPWPVLLPSGSDRHRHGQSSGLPPAAATKEELLCPCTRTSPTSALYARAAPGPAPLPSLCRRPARAPRSATHPSPMASRWDSSSDGRKTLRNSAEKMPPFFMTLVLRMLSVGARFGCLKSRNSLWGEGGQRAPAPGPRGPWTQTHLAGGTFSGRLDQSQIQSEFFFRMLSTSFLLSMKSSSDCGEMKSMNLLPPPQEARRPPEPMAQPHHTPEEGPPGTPAALSCRHRPREAPASRDRRPQRRRLWFRL